MLRLMENKTTFGFALESPAYTAATLTASNYNQRVFNVKVDPKTAMFAQKQALPDYSKPLSIAGQRQMTVSCSVNLYPGPAVNTAPQYFLLFQACGWKQTTYTTTGVSVGPHADYNRVPATIEVAIPEEGTAYRQIVYKMHGAMGMVKINMNQVGQPISADFTFTGALDAIGTRASGAVLMPTAFDTALPPAVLAATFSFFSTIQYPAKFSVEGGEKVEMFSNLTTSNGYDGARVTDRDMKLTLDPDMVVPADLDLYTAQITNTTGQLSTTIGGAIPLTLSAPVAQITESYKGTAREGHVANDLKVELKRSTNGNDEFLLLQGTLS